MTEDTLSEGEQVGQEYHEQDILDNVKILLGILNRLFTNIPFRLKSQ